MNAPHLAPHMTCLLILNHHEPTTNHSAEDRADPQSRGNGRANERGGPGSRNQTSRRATTRRANDMGAGAPPFLFILSFFF
jgi:hypothetical protein